MIKIVLLLSLYLSGQYGICPTCIGDEIRVAKIKYLCQDNGGVYMWSYIKPRLTIICNGGRNIIFTLEQLDAVSHPDIYNHLNKEKNK